MPKKKINRNDTKKVKGKSHKKKKSKENIEPEKIDIPKRPKIIREKKELIHDNPCQSNEGIAKIMIDKIITLSVRKSYLNSINNKLKDYYFENLKTQINTLFATNNIFYYDEPEIDQCNKTELFWNKKYEKNNTWIEISEPNTSKCDRYENAFMNYVNFKYKSSIKLPAVSNPSIIRSNTIQEIVSNKNKEEIVIRPIYKQFSVKISGLKRIQNNNKQMLDTLEEKSSLSSLEEENKDNKNTLNKTNKKPDKKKPLNKTPTRNSQSLFANEISNQRSNSNITNNTNNINKKPKKEPILEMHTKEIPGIDKEYNYDRYDPPDINMLRKERQEEIIRKEIEERKNAKIKNVINNTKNENTIDNFIDTNTKIKMFDSNKYSFDSNGKIISFKPIKMDSLIKDFASLQNSIKNLDNPAKFKKFVKKNKNISPNKNDGTKNKSEVKKEKIIKNPEDDPNGINRHNFVKINTDKNEIIPSGSNFSIMLPNIGVILKEDEQIKEGTREFGKYFKKYSLNDYDKILRDYVPLQNKTMLKNKMNQSMNNMNLNMTMSKKLSKNYLSNTNNSFKMSSNNNLLLSPTQNYSQNNADISNPLINQADTIQENEYMNSYNINNEFNLNNLNSIGNSSIFKSNNKSNNYSLNSAPFNLMKSGSYDTLQGFIKLNKNGSSLKKELDSLKDLDDKSNMDFFPPPNNIDLKSRNVFANNYKDIINEKKKQMAKTKIKQNHFNEFNKKILLTKGWGTKTMSKNMSTGNLLVSKHLTRYQALRELGSSLLNGIKVKLPRDRKVDVKI